MFTITPRAISKEIEKLCRDLVKEPHPVFLPVTPVDHAQVVDCFPAIERQIQEHGGSICYGWQIWEWPGVMIEAEFHGVWKDLGGVLFDITPKQQPTSRILFLPDPVRIYEGRQVANVRRSLSPDPVIKTYISAAEAEYELMNRGDRANQHGEITLEGDEAREMAEIRRRQMAAFLELSQRQPGRNDPCHCGSGKKYKKCHG